MITIELPTQLEQQLQTEWADLNRHALEAVVTEAFVQGKLSSGQVAQALGLGDRWGGINFLSDRGVYPGYGEAEFAQDLDTLAKFNERRGR